MVWDRAEGEGPSVAPWRSVVCLYPGRGPAQGRIVSQDARPQIPAVTKPTNEATPPTGEHDSEHHPIGRRRGRLSFANRLRAYFLAGIIVVAPIGITIFIVWHVVRYFDRTAA